MNGYPREHGEGKGFWDGGEPGHSENGQAAGRPSGFPGTRKRKRLGVRTDLEFPAVDREKPAKAGE